jgi:hypothetical protein
VHAVDAAIGPEIQEHDLATQFAQRERFFRVQPFEAYGKIGRIDLALEEPEGCRIR